MCVPDSEQRKRPRSFEGRSGGITMIERIDEVLEKKVRPALLSHEGDVQIVEYADGVLKIRLTGHCSGCPSARLTTEELIAAEVQKEIPEVKEVVLVNEISPENRQLFVDATAPVYDEVRTEIGDELVDMALAAQAG